jgi:uncharacterized protein
MKTLFLHPHFKTRLMYQTERFLENKTPFFQLIMLIILVLFSVMFTLFLGVLLAIPFYGANILDMYAEAANLSDESSVAILKYFQAISQTGMFIIPSFVFSFLASAHVARYLKIDTWPSFTSVIATLILIFTILPGINWLVEINETMSFPEWMQGIENWMRQSEESAARLTEAFLKTDTFTGLMLNLFIVAVLAAIGEELLFRGVLLRILKNWFQNTHLAIWVSAILFSMFHLQFFGFLPRLALGVLFGYLMVWSGSLWLPILAHFINNAGAVIVYYFYHKKISETPVEDFGTLDNQLLFIISLLISAGLLFIIYYKNKLKPDRIIH